ncbi:MAG: imidazole glycerol phosphate synthase subunit HisH [Candidatus Puniceispirillum sp.]|mgnify:CR=1 FL=1|jgi:imidazole glycerol-phosphate synthase subunit HisH|nr:imidazole glycerol phosphate synthase subunit HisH [Candidatus Puniceispirillum sp.]
MIAIIDSGGANIASVQFALERLNARSILTTDAAIIRDAERVILPGVGAAPVAMDILSKANLVDVIHSLTQPVLGVCLGMQLLFDRSPEKAVGSDQDTSLLGLTSGNCSAFTPAIDRSVPHMGWNSLEFTSEHALLDGIDQGAYVYFVHSYFAPINSATIASCNYGDRFTAIVADRNFMGCQFHPERSGPVGARILKNFLEMPA